MTQPQSLRRVVVAGGVRIPFCRSNTLYADLSNLEMMTTTLNGLVEKFHLQGVHVDEVVGGSVPRQFLTLGLTFNLCSFLSLCVVGVVAGVAGKANLGGPRFRQVMRVVAGLAFILVAARSARALLG